MSNRSPSSRRRRPLARSAVFASCLAGILPLEGVSRLFEWDGQDARG